MGLGCDELTWTVLGPVLVEQGDHAEVRFKIMGVYGHVSGEEAKRDT